MHLEQAHGPAANGTQSWHGWVGCGRLGRLHAVLLSAGQCKGEVLLLLACHLSAGRARSVGCSKENSWEKASGDKWVIGTLLAIVLIWGKLLGKYPGGKVPL